MEVDLALAIVKELLAPEYLNPPQEMIFRAAWDGQSYRALATAAGYDPNYIRGVGSRLWRMLATATKQQVTKSNFRQILDSLATLDFPEQIEPPSPKSRIDWGEAIDVSVFYGREAERQQLQQWLIRDRCRLVAVLGMGGMGKTTIALKLVQDLQSITRGDGIGTHPQPLRWRSLSFGDGGEYNGGKDEGGGEEETENDASNQQSQFKYILWRSLLNAPLLKELLPELIRTLLLRGASPVNRRVADHQFHAELMPKTVGDQIELLLAICQEHRCLIVLDNCESIFQGGAQVGQYRAGYADYADLLSSMGRVNHQSCLLLTSREKPIEIGQLEGLNGKVRTLVLKGLDTESGRQIFIDRGCLPIAPLEWAEIEQYYGGNPLAFQLVAAVVKEVADGDVSEIFPYLRSERLGFADIHILLEQQWERLTPAEHHVMYWLAIQREPMSLVDLEAVLHPAWNRDGDRSQTLTTVSSLLTILQSLRRRSTIEYRQRHWSLQPVVMEYVTGKFVSQICAEIEVQQPVLLNTHAIVQAGNKEYIRQSQLRLIVQPAIESLRNSIGNLAQIGANLREILAQWRIFKPLQQGYLAGNILNVLIHLKLDLTDLDCSQLVVQQAYLVGVELPGVSFANSVMVDCTFTQTFSNVLAIAYSPDGNTLAASDSNGEIRVWRTIDSQCVLICSGHTNWVRGIKFSPDGQYLASSSDDRTIKLWDLQDGICLRTFGEGIHSLGLSFSPDGKFIASGSANCHIYYWDVQTGVCIKQFEGHEHWSIKVRFHPVGHKLVSGSADGTVRVWDVASGECDRVWKAHENWVTTVDYSPDGNYILSASLDGTLRLWDAFEGVGSVGSVGGEIENQPTQCRLVLTGDGDEIWSAVFSPDGECFASVGVGGWLRIWRTADGHCLHRLEGHSDRLWSVAFHPHGQRIASGGEDRTIRFWQVSNGKCLQALSGYTNSFHAIAWSPDRQRLITASRDTQIRVWDLHTDACLYQLSGHTKPTTTVAYHPQGQTFASGSDDRTIRIWDARTLACTQILRGHTGGISALVYSSNGKYLVSAGIDRTIRIWDIQLGRCLYVRTGHSDRIRGLAYHPHLDLIASASEDCTVRIWDLHHNTPTQILNHPHRVVAVAFDPHGAILATGGMDSEILLWNISTGELLHRLSGLDRWILTLTYSPDGNWLIAGASDYSIEVWSMTSGTCIQTAIGHQSWVWSVAVSGCGRFLASASEDETIRLWDLPTGDLVSTRRARRPYEGLNITGIDGLTKAQIDGIKALGGRDTD